MSHSFVAPIIILIADMEDEFDAIVEGDYSPAEGDDWNSPRLAARYEVESVVIKREINGIPRVLDMTGWLSDATMNSLKAAGLADVQGEIEQAQCDAAEMRAEAREEWLREGEFR